MLIQSIEIGKRENFINFVNGGRGSPFEIDYIALRDSKALSFKIIHLVLMFYYHNIGQPCTIH